MMGPFYYLTPPFAQSCSSPTTPKPLPCPTFCFSPKYPVINPVQSQTAFPLHPIMCHTSRQQPFIQKIIQRAALDDSSLILMVFTPWPWGWDCAGTVLGGVQTGCSFFRSCWFGCLPAIVPLCSFGLYLPLGISRNCRPFDKINLHSQDLHSWTLRNVNNCPNGIMEHRRALYKKVNVDSLPLLYS